MYGVIVQIFCGDGLDCILIIDVDVCDVGVQQDMRLFQFFVIQVGELFVIFVENLEIGIQFCFIEGWWVVIDEVL